MYGKDWKKVSSESVRSFALRDIFERYRGIKLILSRGTTKETNARRNG